MGKISDSNPFYFVNFWLNLIDGIFTKEADIDAGVNFAISVPLIQQSLALQLKAGVQF